MSLSSGSRFGPYEVVSLLGAGGMGEVFRAKDTSLKREVALKVLPRAFIADADRLARFRREAEILAALNHPNIAQVYGLEHIDGQTAIVMELVEGLTLAERIKDGPIPPDEAMAIALQVVAALEAAHARQIVHRDLKPANVKLRLDGTVKVLDFGISKPIDPATISGGTPVATTPAMTETGVILGTAAYMSPEQARGRFVDERTDIWAFGCLLFEMLTGQPAFGGEDVMATLARVIDRPTNLNSLPKALPPAVRQTISLCLEKEAGKRIADIRDVRLALEGRFVPDMPQAIGVAAAASGWRRSLLPAAALALGAALMALIGTALEPEVAPALPVRSQIHTVPLELHPALENNPPILAIAPDGSEFAWASRAGLVRRELSDLDGVVVPGTAGTVAIAPHYSSNGDFLVYGIVDGPGVEALMRVPALGGTPVQLLADMPNYGWWPERDGGWLASMRGDFCKVVRIAPAGGEPEPLFEDSTIRCSQPKGLPDGEHLLLQEQAVQSSPDEGWSVSVRSLATGEAAMEAFAGQMPVVVDDRFLVYFDPLRGIMARAFDPATLAYGAAVLMVDDVQRMAGGQGIQGRVAADGTLVYLRDDSRRREAFFELAAMDATGDLRGLDLVAGDIGQPVYSPNGNWLALHRGLPGAEHIWVYDLSGASEPRQLTSEPRNANASWSVDSLSLIFASSRAGAMPGVWRQRADGRSPAEPLTEPDGRTGQIHAVMAPDGRLVFTQITNTSRVTDIMIATVPGGEAELLIDRAGSQSQAAFAADGSAIAYVSEGEIYVEPWPRDGSTPLRVSDASGTARSPVWSAVGSRLAFESGAEHVAVVEIDTAALAISRRLQTFEVPLRDAGELPGRKIAARPDSDSWLVVVQGGEGNRMAMAAEFVIVENWIRELEARVPPL